MYNCYQVENRFVEFEIPTRAGARRKFDFEFGPDSISKTEISQGIFLLYSILWNQPVLLLSAASLLATTHPADPAPTEISFRPSHGLFNELFWCKTIIGNVIDVIIYSIMIFSSLNDVTYYIIIWRFRKCSLVGFKRFNFLTVNQNLSISLKDFLLRSSYQVESLLLANWTFLASSIGIWFSYPWMISIKLCLELFWELLTGNSSKTLNYIRTTN